MIYTPTALSNADVLALIGVCGVGRTADRNRALFDLLYHSGLRIAEALALKVEDVSSFPVDGKIVNQIEVRHGKGDRARTVTLTLTYGHWDSWLARCRGGLIFTAKNGKPVNQSYLRALLCRLRIKAKINKRVHLHALRHAHAVGVWHATKNLAVVSKQLGHSKLSTTDTYLRGLVVDLTQLAGVSLS